MHLSEIGNCSVLHFGFGHTTFNSAPHFSQTLSKKVSCPHFGHFILRFSPHEGQFTQSFFKISLHLGHLKNIGSDFPHTGHTFDSLGISLPQNLQGTLYPDIKILLLIVTGFYHFFNTLLPSLQSGMAYSSDKLAS